MLESKAERIATVRQLIGVFKRQLNEPKLFV